MLVTREWAYGSLAASGNLRVPFLFDGAACRADHGHPAHHQSRESWPSDLPAHECEAHRTRTVGSLSPGETASLHDLGTSLETGRGLQQEGCHWSAQNVFLGKVLAMRGILKGSVNSWSAVPMPAT